MLLSDWRHRCAAYSLSYSGLSDDARVAVAVLEVMTLDMLAVEFTLYERLRVRSLGLFQRDA